MFLPHPRVKVSIVGSLRDREVACSASDRQGSNFESCVWRAVSSQSSHHPQEVLLAQFSIYVHKGGLKPDSFHLSQLPLMYMTSHIMSDNFSANVRRSAVAGSIFGQRRRRWPNIRPALVQHFGFAAKVGVDNTTHLSRKTRHSVWYFCLDKNSSSPITVS